MRSRVRKALGRFLLLALVFNGFAGLAPGPMQVQAQGGQVRQDRAIVINADQPNVWTLEQAHYLLAQMHRRNLDLKATGLGALDPNEINGLRFDVLRQLVELGVEFNQAERETNRLVSRNQNFNAERRPALINRRDQLQDESLDLARDITDLQSEKAGATTQDDKDRLDAKIAAKTSRRAEVDKRIEQINEELKTLNAPSGSLQATEAEAQFEPEKLPKSGAFDEAFKAAAKTQIEAFNQAPKLNATLRLENFLQMQYEIIAKQLTLLRDEVGPGERLLFLELPQTVNVTHHEADKKWAQSWWRIVGYTRNMTEYLQDGSFQRREDSRKNLSDNSAPESTSKKMEDLLRGLGGGTPNARTKQLTEGNEYVNLQSEQTATVPVWDGSTKRNVPISDRTVRAVELIPRQSSLNVNDMNLRVKSGAFSAVASFLFGFGARLNVQRQREQFSQFVQQELYSSAFGKGSREFGWTFTPMPGTDRLLSGVRTTYAVVIVPEEATSLLLESNGCFFPRSAYQPVDFNDTLSKDRWNVDQRTSRNCAESKAFLLPIPVGGNGRNDFYVDRVFYRAVDKGERIGVSINGYNFSSQTGVLVNGSPLTQAIGLAQPLIRDDSETGAKTADDIKNEKVHGRIERIDSEQIVFSFEMPPEFTGTPTITLVAPGKAIDINRLSLRRVNTVPNTSLDAEESTSPMFNRDPSPDVKIDGIEVFRSADGRTLTVLASGKGFNSATQLAFVNGVPTGPEAFVSSNLVRATISTPPDETVQLVMTTGNRTIKSKAVPNPAYLRINNVTVVSFEPAAETGGTPILIVKLEGSGFSDSLVPSNGTLTRVSSTEALLKIVNPAPATTLILTGFHAKTVIIRRRGPS
jgi:hypothetical protein